MLSVLIKSNTLLLPIGIRISIISIVYLWIVFALLKTLKSRKLLAAAVSLLLVIPVCFLIDFTLFKIIGEPIFDIWDVLTFLIIAVAAAVLFIIDFTIRKNNKGK